MEVPNIKFKMEIDNLKDEMLNDYNNEKLIWYYLTFDKRERLLHEVEWQLYIINNEENIIFFLWLELYCIENNLEFPFKEKIKVTTNINKTYKNLETKESEIGIHPPYNDILIKKRRK